MEGKDMTSESVRALQEIRQALELAPNDPKVQEIATEISSFFPGGMTANGASFDFPWLTATPLPPTPMVEAILSTETPPSQMTLTPRPNTASPTPVSQPLTTSKPALPFCGGAVIIPLGFLILMQRRVYYTRRKRF
jgi:hypothetical protein